MAELDHGAKLLAAAAGRELARLAGVECRTWRPLESTLQATTERLADRVFRAGRGRERFVVYFEFLAAWKRNARWGMLGKPGLLSEREGLPTVCVAVVLRPRGYRPLNGPFQLSAAGRPTQALWPREICLWQVTPEPWWEETAGLMPLYPLCRHGRRPQEAVRHASGVIETAVPAAIERADTLALLNIFGKAAYPGLRVADLIGREKMKESEFYLESVQEGRVQRAQDDIVKVLVQRFQGADAAALTGDVRGIDDLAQLDELFSLSLRCKRLDEFSRALPAPGPTR